MSTNSEQYLWNFLYSLAFAGFALLLANTLIQVHGVLPTSISFFDFVLLALATFRLIRLFVYDKITLFIREPLASFSRGPLKTFSDLLCCPWCFGIWSALVVSFFYFLTPLSWFFILALALSGIASFLQILINMIGWKAEQLKREVQGKN